MEIVVSRGTFVEFGDGPSVKSIPLCTIRSFEGVEYAD